MFIESVRARATCNTIISSHPVSSHRPCISSMFSSLSLWALFPSFLFPFRCLLIYRLSFLLFPMSLTFWALPSSSSFSILLPSRRSSSAFACSFFHFIPRLRDVHSILSHLPETFYVVPFSLSPDGTFIHFEPGKRADQPPG